MSVNLVKTGNVTPHILQDDEKTKFSYQVADAGVLRVLCAGDDLKWYVLREYAPQAWTEVSGTRYVLGAEALAGSGGKAARREPTVHAF